MQLNHLESISFGEEDGVCVAAEELAQDQTLCALQ